MRDIKFINGEFYHIFNRGNNKRLIFTSQFDLCRFLQSMDEFNVRGPIGSIYAQSFKKDSLNSSTTKSQRLVDFVCYCLNPNHYHLLIKQLVNDGIREFMHKLGAGYTRYFNERYKLSGSLFQGRFKAIHIDSNDYLLHLSVYINLNNKVHKLSSSATKLSSSSWNEYIRPFKSNDFCKKDIILSQFQSISSYKEFACDALKTIRDRKDMEKSLELLLSS
ncbi:MAG: transposase [Candidatus Yanofskybacteria bacterium]|nr:transposase [Candidatus Yanofskybacteria bacterium]